MKPGGNSPWLQSLDPCPLCEGYDEFWLLAPSCFSPDCGRHLGSPLSDDSSVFYFTSRPLPWKVIVDNHESSHIFLCSYSKTQDRLKFLFYCVVYDNAIPSFSILSKLLHLTMHSTSSIEPHSFFYNNRVIFPNVHKLQFSQLYSIFMGIPISCNSQNIKKDPVLLPPFLSPGSFTACRPVKEDAD